LNFTLIEEEDGVVYLSRTAKKPNKGGIRYSHEHVKVSQPNTRSADQAFAVNRAHYATLEDSFRVECQAFLNRFQNGELSSRQATLQFSKNLSDFYGKMYALGKASVGNRLPLSLQEKRWLHGQHASDMKYFHRFVKQMSRGEGRMKYEHRMDLYALGGTSSYYRGAVASSNKTDRWYWMMSEAEHCKDCLRNSAESVQMGGFRREDLMGRVGVPGQKTRCGHRCRCGLVMRRGRALPRIRPTSFRHVETMLPRSEES
jgi:hypothetical protein